MSSRRAWAAWVVVCLVWGTTYLAIRIALETIPPLLMASFRWIVAGAVLIAILAARGEPLPPRRSWGSLAVLGFLLLGLGNGGILALVWPEAGVGAAGREFLGGVVAAQVACVGWAIGSTYARRHAREDNVLAAAAFQMLFGGLFLFVAGLLHGEWRDLVFNPRTSAALGYLICFGAIGGFSAYAYALKHLPIATVSLYAYINPVIAVLLGTLVLNEPFNARMAISAAVVLAGVGMVREA